MYYEYQIADASKWARWPGPKSLAAKGSCCYWGVKWHERIQDNGHNGKQWTRNTPGCVAHLAWSTSIAFFQRAPFSRALTLSGRATFTSMQKSWQKLDSPEPLLRKTSKRNIENTPLMPGHKCVQYDKINFGGSGPGTKMESNVGSAESN